MLQTLLATGVVVRPDLVINHKPLAHTHTATAPHTAPDLGAVSGFDN